MKVIFWLTKDNERPNFVCEVPVVVNAEDDTCHVIMDTSGLQAFAELFNTILETVRSAQKKELTEVVPPKHKRRTKAEMALARTEAGASA